VRLQPLSFECTHTLTRELPCERAYVYVCVCVLCFAAVQLDVEEYPVSIFSFIELR
jgi:hypothetical protein